MKTAIIDSSYLVYKSHFAFQNNQLSVFKKRKRILTSAIFGFIREIIRLYNEYGYEFIIAAWDYPPYIKKQLYPKYKQNRKKIDAAPDLSIEKSLIKAILHDLNIPCLAAKGYEGEEVAASVIEKMNGHPIDLYTNDEDCYALISPRTSLINTAYDKDMRRSVLSLFTLSDLKRKYNVTPKGFRQMKILMGCKQSDNVPGVQGVGPSKSSELINRFQTVKGVFENINIIEKEKPALAKKLREAKQKGILSISKKLTKIEKPERLTCFKPEQELAFDEILQYLDAKTMLAGTNKILLKAMKKKFKKHNETTEERIRWETETLR